MDDTKRTRLGLGSALATGIAILIAGVITVLAVNTKSFWGDEIHSLNLAVASGSQFFETLASDYHPPLYFLLLKSWIALCGDGEVALRIFQGVQVFVLLWLSLGLFRKCFPTHRFHPAFVVLAFSSELWLFGPMLRYYTLAALLVVVSSSALMQWLSTARRSQGILLVACYVALLYTDYPAAVVIPFHVLYVAVKERNKLRAHLGMSVAAGVLFSPWAVVLAGQISALASASTVADLNDSPAAIVLKCAYSSYAFLFGETVFPFETPTVAGLALVVVAIVAGRPRWRRLVGSRELAFAGGLVVIGVVATALITTFISRHTSFIYVPARTFFALPFVFVALGTMGRSMRRPVWGGVMLGAILAVNVYGTVNWALGRHFMMPVYASPWKQVLYDIDGADGLILVDESLCYEYYRQRRTGAFPRRIEPESIAELETEIRTAAGGNDVDVRVILTGRESTAHGIPPAILEHLTSVGTIVGAPTKYVVVDPRYRALKAKALKRDAYDAKITLTTFRVRVGRDE